MGATFLNKSTPIIYHWLGNVFRIHHFLNDDFFRKLCLNCRPRSFHGNHLFTFLPLYFTVVINTNDYEYYRQYCCYCDYNEDDFHF